MNIIIVSLKAWAFLLTIGLFSLKRLDVSSFVVPLVAMVLGRYAPLRFVTRDGKWLIGFAESIISYSITYRISPLYVMQSPIFNGFSAFIAFEIALSFGFLVYVGMTIGAINRSKTQKAGKKVGKSIVPKNHWLHKKII